MRPPARNTATDCSTPQGFSLPLPRTPITILAAARQIVWFGTAFRSDDDRSLIDLDIASRRTHISSANRGRRLAGTGVCAPKRRNSAGFARYRLCSPMLQVRFERAWQRSRGGCGVDAQARLRRLGAARHLVSLRSESRHGAGDSDGRVQLACSRIRTANRSVRIPTRQGCGSGSARP